MSKTCFQKCQISRVLTPRLLKFERNKKTKNDYFIFFLMFHYFFVKPIFLYFPMFSYLLFPMFFPCSMFFYFPYAQTLIVVVLIVVNFGGFLVIARNPRNEF